MYLSRVMQTQPKYTTHNTLCQHNNIDRVKENDKSWKSYLILTYKKINKNNLSFFNSLRVGRILYILQSDWFLERVVFYNLAH